MGALTVNAIDFCARIPRFFSGSCQAERPGSPLTTFKCAYERKVRLRGGGRTHRHIGLCDDPIRGVALTRDVGAHRTARLPLRSIPRLSTRRPGLARRAEGEWRGVPRGSGVYGSTSDATSVLYFSPYPLLLVLQRVLASLPYDVTSSVLRPCGRRLRRIEE